MRDAPNQIQGNDWVRHGFAPMMTTHIVRSCVRNGESRETYPHETTSLNHNLRRIICYILYSEPVWPKRRITVRMFWYWTTTQIRNVLLSGLWMQRLFDFDCCLFGYLPEPIKEKSLLSGESQQRQPPLPMRLPPIFRALCHRSLPQPDLRRYEATLWIPKTTFLPMRASLDPLFLQRSSPSRYDQVV
jgi:hypothetical protein